MRFLVVCKVIQILGGEGTDVTGVGLLRVMAHGVLVKRVL